MRLIMMASLLIATNAAAMDWPSGPTEMAMLEGEARFWERDGVGEAVRVTWPKGPRFEVVTPKVEVLLQPSNADINELVETSAKTHGVDPKLVHAVIKAESNYDPTAVSPKGAIGLMQLMPGTAERFGVDPWQPAQNIDGGVRYLKWLLEQFGDISLALAGYNAGEGAVMKYGRTIPPYRETQNYVDKVLALYGGR